MFSLSNAMSPDDYTYYGNLKNGGIGYGHDISKFANVTGVIDPTVQNNGTYQQYGNFGASSGIQQNPFMKGLLGGYEKDPTTGAMVKTPGLGNFGLGLAGLGLNWWLGNKQMDLGREQLDFSKESFWNNYMAQMDEANYARNLAMRNHERNNYANAHPGDDAGLNAYSEQLQNTMDTGEVRYNGDGTVSNLTNPKGFQYTGQGYGQNAQPAPQAPSAFAPVASTPELGSQIPDYMRADTAPRSTMSSTNTTESSKPSQPQTAENRVQDRKDKEKKVVRKRTVVRQ